MCKKNSGWTHDEIHQARKTYKRNQKKKRNWLFRTFCCQHHWKLENLDDLNGLIERPNCPGGYIGLICVYCEEKNSIGLNEYSLLEYR